MTAPYDQTRRLDTELVTWTALLGHWVEFARSAMALPNDEVGQTMRASVADIITLQAVYLSLRDINRLPTDERMLGLDRAEVAIDNASAALKQRWEKGMPEKIDQLINDARVQLSVAESVVGRDKGATDAP